MTLILIPSTLVTLSTFSEAQIFGGSFSLYFPTFSNKSLLIIWEREYCNKVRKIGKFLKKKTIPTLISLQFHPDSPHFTNLLPYSHSHPHFSHSHPDSLRSHPHSQQFPHSHPHLPHSYHRSPHSPHCYPDFLDTHPIPHVSLIPTYIPQFPLIPFHDFPFWILQITIS